VPAANEPAEERGERLQRVLAAAGVASRRKAEELISAGRVTVDGKVVTELGTRVDPRQADVRVDGRRVRPKPFRYIVLNKPSGFITTTSDERGRQTVMDLLPPGLRVFPVGRLDRDTEGLLLLTNDGDVAHRVMHPRYGLAKEYHVLTPSRPSDQTIGRVRRGVAIDGRQVVPEEFRILRQTADGLILKIVVHEGMNRLVRRLMDAVGIPVGGLRRVRVGPLSVAGIPVGGARELTEGERSSLFEALRLSPAADARSTPGPSRPRPDPTAGSAKQKRAHGHDGGHEHEPADETGGGPVAPSRDRPHGGGGAGRGSRRRGRGRRRPRPGGGD
jgi:23S rRNA pseudouridine2605 synthase